MRLTLMLLRKRMPNGHIWRGKHRLTPTVTPLHKINLLDDIRREERNMLLLRHPFLTKEQEFGHVAHLNKHQNWLQEKKEKKANYRPHTKIEDMLGHLRHADSWER